MGTWDQISNLLKNHKWADQAEQPLMNVEAARADLAVWLADLKLPAGSTVKSWEEMIRIFPASPSEQNETSGVKMRLALRLFTAENTYLISVMECLDLDSRGVYLISVYVNWKLPEWQIQKMVEESYHGRFDECLRAKHALWAQTYRQPEFLDALTACFKAILSHELVSAHEPDGAATQISPMLPSAARFPKLDES
jgi:hypothetical protein